MKVITLAAQKGGVGKTTLAVNLAVGAGLAGYKTALIDLDRQESASAWADLRKDERPYVEPVSPRRLAQTIEAARGNGFDLVILDTPPAAGEEASEALRAADLALIPCRPSLIDLEAIKRTAAGVRTTGTPGYVVINTAPPTATVLVDDAREIAGGGGLAIAPVILRERSAYRNAWPHGQGVMEYEPKGKAAAEIAELQTFIIACLQI